VLLDLVLPRLDGVEVARRLRNDPATADIRIIATTASWLGEKWDFLASAGFDGALRKPFTGAELFAKLEHVLSSVAHEAPSRERPAR
jgi:CheY-like chemotaxis protein